MPECFEGIGSRTDIVKDPCVNNSKKTKGIVKHGDKKNHENRGFYACKAFVVSNVFHESISHINTRYPFEKNSRQY